MSQTKKGMRYIIITFIIVLPALVLSSCGGEKVPDNVVQVLDENGKKLMEYEYTVTANGDTLKHGQYRSYYENGQIEISSIYVDDMKEGAEHMYFENGSLKMSGWYKNDKADSLWTAFYDNSGKDTEPQKKTVGYWFRGEKVSHQYFYRQDGTLEQYRFYNPMEELFYKREYNADTITEDGCICPQLVMVNETNSVFEVGDTLVARVYFVSPPGVETNYTVQLEGIPESHNPPLQQVYDSYIHYKYVLQQPGEFTIVATNTRIGTDNETEDKVLSFTFVVNTAQ